MFFLISKLLSPVLVPGNFLVLAVTLGTVLLALGLRRSGFALVAFGAACLLAVLFLPVNQWLMAPLENRFPRPNWPAHVTGIVVLGAGEQPAISETRGIPTENIGEGVLVAVAELTRRYPEARVIFTGGTPGLTGQGAPGTTVARGIFDQMGIDPTRVTYEPKARDTWENLLFSQRLASPKPGENWLLVTRALHMPRSIGVAHQLGWEMLPWPADYQTRADTTFSRWSVSENLMQVDEAVHEWAGLLAYWASGRAKTLLPDNAGERANVAAK